MAERLPSLSFYVNADEYDEIPGPVYDQRAQAGMEDLRSTGYYTDSLGFPAGSPSRAWRWPQA